MISRNTLLVNLTTGVENPTRAALALLVAATAASEGAHVNVFIAGDGVSILRPETIESARGIGTGEIKVHIQTLKDAGVGLWASGQSAAARGISAENLQSIGFIASPPSKLIELAFASDRVLSY